VLMRPHTGKIECVSGFVHVCASSEKQRMYLTQCAHCDFRPGQHHCCVHICVYVRVCSSHLNGFLRFKDGDEVEEGSAAGSSVH